MDAAGAELAADLAGEQQEESKGVAAAGGADMEPLVRVLHSEDDRRQLEQQLQQETAAAAAQQPQPGEHMRRVDETAIPTGAPVEPRCIRLLAWL